MKKPGAGRFIRNCKNRPSALFPRFQYRPRALAGSIAALVAGLALWLPGQVKGVPPPPPAPSSAYWTGGLNGVWATDNSGATNWATSSAGTTDTRAVPGASTDVFFSASNATNLNTTLGQNFTIHSLTISDPAAVTINSGTGGLHTLTISGNPGTGITIDSGAGLATIGANITFAGFSNTITVGNTAGLVINGMIGGDNGLIKAGTGTLTLNAANDYTGGTTISAGTVKLGIANALPDETALSVSGSLDLAGFNQAVAGVTGSGTVTDSGGPATLTVNNFGADTFAGTVTGANLALVKQGFGTLTLTSANTYGGATTIGTGTVVDGINNALPTTTALSVEGTLNLAGFSQGVASVTGFGTVTDGGGPATFTVNNSGTDSFAGTITGANLALVKQGAGTLILTSQNTYGGATTISSGTIADETNNALPTTTSLSVAGTLDLAGSNQQVASVTGSGTVTDSGGASTFTVNNFGTDSFAGTITGANLALVKQGFGTLTLTSANTYGAATTISAGTIADGINNALPTTTTLSVEGTLNLAGFNQQVASVTGFGSVTDGGGPATFTVNNSRPDFFLGTITGTNLALVKQGFGTLTLTSANSYGGATTIGAGTIVDGTNNALPTTTSLSVAGTLDLAGSNQQVASVTGSGTITDSGRASAFTVNNSGADNFAGTITGANLALVKQGAGTLTLGGANTYSGTTNIRGGALQVNGSLGHTAVTVENGATLGGTGSIAGAVTVMRGGILSPGDAPGTLTVGSLTLNSGSISNYQLSTPGVIGSGVNDLTVVNGNLVLGGTLNVTNAGSFGPGAYQLFQYTGSLTNNTLAVGTVPTGYTAASNFIVVTGVAHQVDLLVLPNGGAAATQFWDGAGPANNGVIDGGSGTWSNFTANFADAAGNNNASWQNGVAVFATPSSGQASSIVTLSGAINFAGLMFTGNGYTINSDNVAGTSFTAIGLPANSNNIASIFTSSGVTATINAVIGGSAGISKDGGGTLELTGVNTYSGGTTINAGVLSITNSGALSTGPVSLGTGGELNGAATMALSNEVTFAATGNSTVSAAAGVTFSLSSVNLAGGNAIFGSAGNTGVVAIGPLTTAIVSSGSTIEVAYGTLQNGGGATNLSYLTTHAASTTVDLGATLDVNDNATEVANLQGAGKVTLGSNAATVLTVDAGSFSGVISGAGQLTSTGILTLTGANTYSGGTTISSGTLLVNNTTGSGTGSGPVVVNSGTLGGSGTIAGAVTLNSGGAIAPGAGSPGVAGTTLHAGSLLWNGGAALNLQLNATTSDQLALTGALTKGTATVGAYTLNISPTNVAQTDYTLATFASTTFSAGDFTLTLPTGYSGALLETNTSLDLVLAYAGGGSVIQNSSPVGTPLIADFTVRGPVTTGTTLQSNTINSLIFTPGSSLQIFNTLTLTSGRVSDGGGISTITGGTLSGPNGLFFNLTGEMFVQSTLQGDLTKTGTGSLFLNGALFGNAQVLIGLLGGTGSIFGNLSNSATVSPGDAPGTLSVSGNYTQSKTGTLVIGIGGTQPGQFDALTIGGTASLNGTLQLVRFGNFDLHRGDTITFLTAGQGITGTFSTVINPFVSQTILEPEVVYGATSVALEMEQGSFATFARRDGLTPNDTAVAAALDKVAFDPRADKLIAYLDNRNLTKLPGDFERISPDQLTSIFQVGTSFSNVQSLNLQQRTEDIRSGSSGFSAFRFAMTGNNPSYSGGLGYDGPVGPVGPEDKEAKVVLNPQPAPLDARWGAFLSGTGEWANIGDTESARGYDLQTGGFTLGVDYKVTPHLAIGVSAGYTGTGVDLADHGRVFVNGGKFGLYGTYFDGGFYTDAAVNGGYNSYDTYRGALDGHARGNADGGELNALFGTGYDWKKAGFTFGPTATFNYTNVRLNSFEESGSLAPLDIHGGNGESLRSAFGAKFSYDWKVLGVILKPEIRAAWQHEFGDTTFALDSNFANGAGNVFTTSGPAIGRDSLLLSGGFALQWNEWFSIYLYYGGELARTNYQESSVTGGCRVDF